MNIELPLVFLLNEMLSLSTNEAIDRGLENGIWASCGINTRVPLHAKILLSWIFMDAPKGPATFVIDMAPHLAFAFYWDCHWSALYQARVYSELMPGRIQILPSSQTLPLIYKVNAKSIVD